MREFIVQEDGTTMFIHDDACVKDLAVLGGPMKVTRASHVEPQHSGDCTVSWYADMSPVGGPSLGPFPDRASALSAETVWLKEHMHLFAVKEGDVCLAENIAGKK